MTDNEQKEPWFLEINPNGRIPALTDKFTDGEQIRIFESGAILQYLVDRYDPDHKVSYAHGSREHWETTGWVSDSTLLVVKQCIAADVYKPAHVADGRVRPNAGPG